MSKIRYFMVLATAAATLTLVVARADDAVQERERAQIAVLQSDAPPANRAMACKRLALVASGEAVPVLVPLLSSHELATWARIALEVIPDPAADEGLREATGKLQGRLLVGAINSIGFRGDSGAVELLVGRLKDADAEVASAAAAALGRIGGPRATAALDSYLAAAPAGVRPAVAEGCILCAEQLLDEGKRDEAVRLYDKVRQADLPRAWKLTATRGAILARGPAGAALLAECLASDDLDVFRLGLRVARELGGPEAVKAVAAELGPIQPPADEAPEALGITKAVYGAGNQTVDVTDRLRAAISANNLTITASNDLAGDPASGQVKQLRVTYTIGGVEKTLVLAENDSIELGEAVPDADPRQVLLVYALGELGEPSVLPIMLALAKDGPWSTRVAAVRMLADLGDARAVPVLLAAAENAGELGQAAIESLAALEGDAVDRAIAEGLPDAEGASRAVLVQLVGQRGIQSAVPTLLEDTRSRDEEVRLAAIQALGMTAGFGHLGVLIEKLATATDAREADTARSALLLACTRMPDRDATADRLLGAMKAAKPETRTALLELIGAVGGNRALAGVAGAARTGDDAVQDAASRVLGEWMTADAGPVLLELAVKGNERFRVRALRGYLRIARQFDVPIDQRMDMCRKAMDAAQRNDEKKLALEVLERYPTAEGLTLAAGQLANTALRADAAATAVAIAEKIVDAAPAAVIEVMLKAAAAAGNPETAQQANALLQRAQAKLR